MGWFPCSGKSNKRAKKKKQDDPIQLTLEKLKANPLLDVKKEGSNDGGSDPIAAQIFTFRQLAAATKNFRADCLLGEGGFGRVYKGRLESTNQIVAIKQLDRNGFQGNREFLVEVLMLNLPLDKKGLGWNTRMKIAAGAAKGLEYLHDKASPPVIYRDLKCSNILLSNGYHPKLSDFGLAKLGPVGDNTHVSTRARPLFKDRRKFSQMADPLLQGQYPVRGLYQALAVAAMCVQEEPTMRPLIADVVTALTYLASQIYDPKAQPIQSSLISPPRMRRDNDKKRNVGGGSERKQARGLN
ncbi:hypothetical protein HHK36_016525 [Tetracentron sinense]|uniref:Protein kinase domain-containing protein n=1 Tax=Tetracentron sinense TaxID=13715 RepID=A0A834Z1I0_TETSI|nr:hypothetical protein HHK36_016525 [Tetracentron sinense]